MSKSLRRNQPRKRPTPSKLQDAKPPQGQPPPPTKAKQPETKFTCAALLEGLVDVVNHRGQPVFLMKVGEELAPRAFVDREGVRYAPPPRAAIPWVLPDAETVARHYKQDTDTALYDDVRAYLQESAELPSAAHYDLATAWVFHTYAQEALTFSPGLIFENPQSECGKSRIAQAMVYASYRGVVLETLREPHILRLAAHFQATLLFDVQDLSTKAERMGSEDILLGRFQKGVTVPRVLYPDRGAFADTVFYHVFGPTLIATNEPIHHLLETRAVTITMLKSPKPFDAPITAQRALPLKARLLGFRARCLGHALPDVPKPASGRLGDITTPLVQVVSLVKPTALPAFIGDANQQPPVIGLVERLAQRRSQERGPSAEVSIVQVVSSLREQARGGLLPVKTITDALNDGRPHYMRFTPHRVGRMLDELGFAKDRTGTNTAAIVWDEAFVTQLTARYAPLTSPGTPGSPESPSPNAPG